MGIYEFKCKKCDEVAEMEMPMRDVGAIYPKCECGETMVRKYSAPPTHYNAAGFTQSNDPLYLPTVHGE